MIKILFSLCYATSTVQNSSNILFWRWIIFIGATGLLIILGLIAVYTWHVACRRTKIKIEVENTGNVPSRYNLRAEPTDSLSFQWALSNGRLLQPLRVSTQVRTVAGQQVQGQARSGSGPNWSQTAQSATQATGIVAKLASFVSPAAASSIRRVGRNTRQVKNVNRRLQRLQGGSGSGHVNVSGGGSAGSLAKSMPVASTSSVTMREVAVQTRRTPIVQPGDKLALLLTITPYNPYLGDAYPLTLISRSAESRSAPRVVIEETVTLKPLSAFERFVSWLLLLSGISTIYLLYAVLFPR